MKQIFTFISCFAFASVLNAQSSVTKVQPATKANTVTHAAPKVVSANELQPAVAEETLSFKQNEYDFGKIPMGKPVTHVFEFVNTGKTPFALENVHASCGCTTPEWNKNIIAPGETSKITVGYNAAAEGPFTKPISITYNGNNVKQIIIKGEVYKTPATSAPENAALKNLQTQQ